MNNKNKEHFSRRLNVQVCELLQVLTEANIKRCFEKEVLLEFYYTINDNLSSVLVNLQACRLIAVNFTNR